MEFCKQNTKLIKSFDCRRIMKDRSRSSQQVQPRAHRSLSLETNEVEFNNLIDEISSFNEIGHDNIESIHSSVPRFHPGSHSIGHGNAQSLSQIAQ